MITTTTDDELQGDNQNTRLESFSMCKHASENEKSRYAYVEHRCRFADCYNRCTRDTCVFDKDESPDVCNKHWVKCIFCQDLFSIDPKQMNVPICDRCISIIAQHLHLPATCAKCGASIGEYTSMPFTRLCEDCISKYLFNDTCWHWELHHEVSTTPLDLP